MKFNELIDLIENGNGAEVAAVIDSQAKEIKGLKGEVDELQGVLDDFEGDDAFKIKTPRDTISFRFEKENLLDQQIIDAVKVLMEQKNGVKVLQLLEKLGGSSILN